MYRYTLTQDAARELDRELAYSEAHWGKRHAGDYARALQARFSDIARHPFAYPEQPDLLPGIRLCVYKGNRIVYTVMEKEKRVVVLGVFSVYQTVAPERIQKRLS